MRSAAINSVGWKLFPRLLAVSTIALSVPAPAAVIVATYTGIVKSGSDQFDFFQTGSTDLTGQKYTLQFTFDTATPGAFDLTNGSTGGIAGLNLQNPMISSTFTLNGVTRNWGVSSAPNFLRSYGNAQQRDSDRTMVYDSAGNYLGVKTIDYVSHESYEYGPNAFPTFGGIAGDRDRAYNVVLTENLAMIAGRDVTAPLAYTLAPADYQYSYGSFESYAYAGFTTRLTRAVRADLLPQRVTIVPFGAAVPEPATWAMMISGFGLVGAAIRRGRTKRPGLAAA
jgi:hypothetical protein